MQNLGDSEEICVCVLSFPHPASLSQIKDNFKALKEPIPVSRFFSGP